MLIEGTLRDVRVRMVVYWPAQAVGFFRFVQMLPEVQIAPRYLGAGKVDPGHPFPPLFFSYPLVSRWL